MNKLKIRYVVKHEARQVEKYSNTHYHEGYYSAVECCYFVWDSLKKKRVKDFSYGLSVNTYAKEYSVKRNKQWLKYRQNVAR